MKAYKWATLSAEQGYPKAVGLQNRIADAMAPYQTAEALQWVETRQEKINQKEDTP